MSEERIPESISPEIRAWQERAAIHHGGLHAVPTGDEDGLSDTDVQRLRHSEYCQAEIDKIPDVFKRDVELRPEVQHWLELFFTLEKDHPDWPDGKNGLLLVGDPGCGKTQHAWQIIRRFLEAGHLGFEFVDCSKIFDVFTDRMRDSQSDKDLIDRYSKVDLLVLDDLGVVELTTHRQGRLQQILDYRWKQRHHTVVTTNFATYELGEVAGARNASRIGGMCRPVAFGKIDYRIGWDYENNRPVGDEGGRS